MKLSKYLRQNSRTLLMVFMSLLLVSFLIPQTIQGLGGGDRALNAKLGQAFGRPVTNRDVEQAHADLQTLSRTLGLAAFSEENVLDYLLQVEEARRMGIHTGRDEVKAFLASGGVTDDVLRNIQRSTHRSYDQIYDCIGRFLTIERLGQLQASAVTASLPRQELAYRDSGQQAVAQLSFINDKAFLRLVPEPTEEQLQAFFNECKTRKTATSEDKLEFGYLLPDRVQVEYLTVDPAKVKNKITVQTVQVKRFFEDNAQRYKKPDPLASQPAPGAPAARVPMTFDEARDFAREDYREARAIETAQRAINDLYVEAHQSWSSPAKDPEGFDPAPANVVSFEELKQRATVDVEYGKTELLGSEQLAKIPNFGTARLLLGRQAMFMPDLALRVKGILAQDPNDGKPVLNLMEPAPVLLSSKKDQNTGQLVPYQAYLFRVVEAAPTAPPESLEPIRTQVIADWKLVQAHELARVRAEALAARARQVGLAAAVEEATELKELLAAADRADAEVTGATSGPAATEYAQDLQPVTTDTLNRRYGVIRRMSMLPPNVPPAIFALADTPADAAAAETHRLTTIPVASQNRWVVAQLDEVKPLYEGVFEQKLAALVQGSEKTERDRFLKDWIAEKNVKERTGFVFEPGVEPGSRRR